jgi:hypothetical protein
MLRCLLQLDTICTE